MHSYVARVVASSWSQESSPEQEVLTALCAHTSQVRDQKHHASIRRKFEKTIDELNNDMESIQPNMKALERFEAVKGQHEDAHSELEKAKEVG